MARISPPAVADGEVQIMEFRMERVLYDFVVAAVLVLRRERPLPRLALLQLASRDDLNAGLLLSDCPCLGLLHSLGSRVGSRRSPDARTRSAGFRYVPEILLCKLQIGQLLTPLSVSPADATQLLTLYGTLRRSPRSSPPLAAAARLRDSPVAAASPRDRSAGSLCDRCQSDQRRMPTGRKGSNTRGAATRSDRPGGRRIYSCARRCGLWRCDRCRAQVRLAGRPGGAMDRCPRRTSILRLFHRPPDQCRPIGSGANRSNT